MSVTIYHNPRCSKSRQTLEIIREKNIEPKIIDYINKRIELSEIKEVFRLLNIETVRLMTRTKESEFKDAGLDENSSDEEIFAAIIKFPKLLERPIVITDKGARICRPPELVNEIL